MAISAVAWMALEGTVLRKESPCQQDNTCDVTVQGTSPVGAKWGGWLHRVARGDSMMKDQFSILREVGLYEATCEKVHRPTHARITLLTPVKCARLGTGAVAVSWC